GPPFFRAFHALAVDDGSSGTGFPFALLAALDVERVMNAIQSAVPTPQVEIVEQRATRRQILRNRPPLASRAQNIHDPVHHLTNVNPTLVPSPFDRWNHRLHMRPLIVSQIAGIPQSAAVVAPTVLRRPHR